MIAADLVKWLPVDSILSVTSVKGQEQWIERQVTCRTPVKAVIEQYLDDYRPDVLVGIETMFSPDIYELCRQRRIRTVLIVMHEAYRPGIPADLFICPTQQAYAKVIEPHKVFFALPFDIEPFPFVLRNQARRFLHVVGYGMLHNRRQTREVIAGFLEADISGATLMVHCQRDWREAYGDHIDERVDFRLETLPEPTAVYDGFDVLVQPDSYAGYNRVLLEAQACGLPVITTAAPPMDTMAGNPSLLVPVEREDDVAVRIFSATCYLVTPAAIAAAVRLAAGPGQAKRSRAARAAAERRAWTAERRREFLSLLEGL